MIGGKIKKQYLLLFDDIVGKCLFRNFSTCAVSKLVTVNGSHVE